MAGHRIIERPVTGSRSSGFAKGIRTGSGGGMTTGSILVWNAETKDSDACFLPSGNQYTAPRDMRLKVDIQALIVEAISTSSFVGLSVHKNGTQMQILAYEPGINSAANQLLTGSWEDDVAAGDVIDVRAIGSWSIYGADGAGKWSWVTYDELPAKAVFPLTFAPVVTALPTSGNYDGREVDFLADATNGVMWRMRYRSSTTRWHFVGGPPLKAYVAAEQGTAVGGNVYVDLSTVGPDLTFPFAGDFEVDWGCYAYTNSPTVTRRIGLVNGAGASVTVNWEALFYGYDTGGTSHIESMSHGPYRTTQTAGSVRRMRYYAPTGAGTEWFGERWITAIPVQSAAGF